MNFSQKTYAGNVEILASKDFDAIPVTVAAPGEGTVVKAGTPLTAAGESTTGSNAVGILLYDVDTAMDPNGSAVVRGIIDSVKAQAHSGVSYNASNLKSALPGVILRGNIAAKSDVAELKTLTIGSLELTPAFDAKIHNYAAATTATQETVTVAVADDSNATAVIKNGTTTVTSGSNAALGDGPNTITVTVTAEDGATTTVYTAVVTKS